MSGVKGQDCKRSSCDRSRKQVFAEKRISDKLQAFSTLVCRRTRERETEPQTKTNKGSYRAVHQRRRVRAVLLPVRAGGTQSDWVFTLLICTRLLPRGVLYALVGLYQALNDAPVTEKTPTWYFAQLKLRSAVHQGTPTASVGSYRHLSFLPPTPSPVGTHAHITATSVESSPLASVVAGGMLFCRSDGQLKALSAYIARDTATMPTTTYHPNCMTTSSPPGSLVCFISLCPSWSLRETQSSDSATLEQCISPSYSLPSVSSPCAARSRRARRAAGATSP